MKLRALVITFIVALLAALPAAADKVLILDTTGNGSSQEAQAALALLPSGSTVDVVDVVDAATLSTLASSGGLSAYRVVILADPQCGHRPALPVIAGSWGKTSPEMWSSSVPTTHTTPCPAEISSFKSRWLTFCPIQKQARSSV